MENRFQKMEEFLNKIVVNVKTQKKRSYKDDIYINLCLFGIEEDEDENINSLKNIQNKIYDEYRFHAFTTCKIFKNILFYRDEQVNSILKLRDNIDSKYYEQIKLYIPINQKGGLNLVMSLFDFLEKELIVNDTKLLSDIRTDNLVVKTFSNEDAMKITEFINKNYADKDIEANPFLINDEKVGLSIEGDVRYNERVAYFINDYLLELSQNNNIDNSNIEGFKNYLENIQSNYFEDKKVIKKILDSKEEIFKNLTDEKFLFDIKNIIDLLLIAIDKEKGLADFDELWDKLNTDEYKKETILSIQKILVKEDSEILNENESEGVKLDYENIDEPDFIDKPDEQADLKWNSAKKTSTGILYQKYFQENSLVPIEKENVFKKIKKFFRTLFSRRNKVVEY